ncbi:MULTISPECIES: flagellar motor switch protein FliG [Arthrobacter]|uniref:Flagellar motor switch protein FliG n=2 Tax=Arthrobacter TaxID=1663 RepID=A0ABU9KJA3_9MICC|nr:flagellar motor switch protein FliG [Arthrobacter sp. YJM1]MDP5226343.1 flagellar motor switch protein FliG [Arthrobacter sp. YJM1]
MSLGTDRPLTGTQKVAIVLMQMSNENAAKVMAHFSDSEAEDVAAEIVRLSRVDATLSEQVIAEFHEIAVAGRRTTRGGRELAAGLLESSFGAERAAGVLDRLTSTMAGKSFEFLESVDPSQLLTLLDGELPETVALVLAHLRPDKASAVMAGLGEAQATDVAHALATMGATTPEAVSIVAESLRARTGTTAAVGLKQIEVIGGVQPLVDIINRSDIAVEKTVLDGLDEKDPALAEEVRSRMLTFADIVKLERRDVQQVLRGIDAGILARAMKGAAQPVLDAIDGNVSDRNREILHSEIAAVGPVRASEVQEARAAIVRSIRELEASGAITVRRTEEDDLVY